MTRKDGAGAGLVSANTAPGEERECEHDYELGILTVTLGIASSSILQIKCTLCDHVLAEDEAVQPTILATGMRKAVEASDELLRVAIAWLGIMNDSHGIIGWHLNGESAGWDEFEEFQQLQQAVEALQQLKGENSVF